MIIESGVIIFLGMLLLGFKLKRRTALRLLGRPLALDLGVDSCLDDPPSGDGSCKVAERVYKCPIPGSTTQPAQYICGDDVYCVNGDCEPIVREASDEFKDAVVALNALGQANSEFDESTLTLPISWSGAASKIRSILRSSRSS